MKQNHLKEELFIILRKSEMHQRELSRVLGVNQTNIRRALLSLEEQNIVDKKDVGKSKLYFIKDSLESQIYEQKVENYKLMKFSEKPKMRKIVNLLYEKVNSGVLPRSLVIVLFGSYAKGDDGAGSDIDIYIDSKSVKYQEEIGEIDGKINVIAGGLKKNLYLLEEIKKNHIVLNNLNGFYDLIK